MIKRPRLVLLSAAMLCAAPAAAAARVAVPTGRVIEGSLMEALAAIRETRLAGIFAFVPRETAPLALADFLYRDRKALKRFVKKGEKDFKLLGGINQWDKKVLLYLVGMSAGGVPGVDALPKSWAARINELSLRMPLRFSDMARIKRVKK